MMLMLSGMLTAQTVDNPPFKARSGSIGNITRIERTPDGTRVYIHAIFRPHYICISDTGNGFSKEALDAIENDTPIIYHGRHHVGISNIKRRLALMYGERASITCSNMDENYGAVVEVRLPKTE